MPGDLLLDTGAVVSLLDRSQSGHARFRAFFEKWRGSVLSTEAVVTECTHLLARLPEGRRVCLDFFVAGGAMVVPSSPQSLARCRDLIVQYADLPMDFADATLVALAEEARTNLILTTDRKDFAVYRIGKKGAFRVLP